MVADRRLLPLYHERVLEMSIPNLDPGAGGGRMVDMTEAENILQSMVTKASAVPVKAAAPTGDPNVANVIDTATNSAADYTTHRIPAGAETLGQAVADLPNDLGGWLTDWLDGFDMAGPLAGLVNVLSGGALQWLTVAFLGLKIIDMGRGLMAPGQRVRGPVSLAYYRIPAQTVDPVVAYLTRSAQIEVRETQPDGQGNVLIGVPVYHSGKSDRAFLYLQQKTGLEYTRI